MRFPRQAKNMVRQIAQSEACLLEVRFRFEYMVTRMSMVMGNLGIDTVPPTRFISFKTEDKFQLFDRGFARPEFLCNRLTNECKH